MNHLENIQEIQRNFDRTANALDMIQAARTAEDLRNAWEDFLFCYHRTIGRLISIAQNSSNSKAWGHRLKNASTKDDEGLVFLREARAHAEHGLTPFAVFQEPGVAVGSNAIMVHGDSNIHFSGNYVNGKCTGTFTLKTEKGFLSSVSGSPKAPISQEPAKIQLEPIISQEKGKTFPVPQSIGGESLESRTPLSLAEQSFAYLSKLLEEYSSIRRT